MSEEAESSPVWVESGMGEARGTNRGAGGSLSKVIISKIRENELGYLDDISSGPFQPSSQRDQVMSVLSVKPQEWSPCTLVWPQVGSALSLLSQLE